MSRESIGKRPCSLSFFKRPTDAGQFEGMPCPAMWKQQFVFSLFSCPPLREGVLSRLCEKQYPSGLCKRQCLLDLCERHCCVPVSCFQYACAISPISLFLGWLMHASPHVVISHLLRALDHVIATRLCETACFIVIAISDIQRASRVSSSGSVHSQ